MQITRAWLNKRGACPEGRDWFVSEGITEPIAGIRNLADKGHWDWANWLIVRVMTRPQYLAYAIFASDQVLAIYEKRHPSDKRPRNAIDAARKVLADDTRENRMAAADAAAYAAADAAAYAADAAYAAADAAAYADADAAYAAADAAADAAAYAAADAYARDKMRKKILDYGLSLLEGEIGGEDER